MISDCIRIPSDTTIFGDGARSTIKMSTSPWRRGPTWDMGGGSRAPKNIVMFANATENWASPQPTTLFDANIHVRDLRLRAFNDGPLGGGMQLLRFSYGREFSARNLWLSGGIPISIIGCTDVAIDNIHIDTAAGSVSPWAGSKRCRFSRIYFTGDLSLIGGSPMAINAADSTRRGGSNLETSDIDVDGIVFHGQTAKLGGAQQAGIEIFPLGSANGNTISRVRVSNCVVNGLGTSAQSGLFIGGATSDVVVTSVRVEGFVAAPAVSLNGEDGHFPSHVKLVDITTVDCHPTPGIPLFELTGSDISVLDCSDVGSRYAVAFGNFAGAKASRLAIHNNHVGRASVAKYRFAVGGAEADIVEPVAK